MTTKATITAVKPVEVLWYSQVSDANAQAATALENWGKNQPGFISLTSTFTDVNTLVREWTFNTMAEYQAYNTGMLQTPTGRAREEYNKTNGIISSTIYS